MGERETGAGERKRERDRDVREKDRKSDRSGRERDRKRDRGGRERERDRGEREGVTEKEKKLQAQKIHGILFCCASLCRTESSTTVDCSTTSVMLQSTVMLQSSYPRDRIVHIGQ